MKQSPLDAREIVEHMNEKLTLELTRANWIALQNHLRENGNFFGARVRVAVAMLDRMLRDCL